MDGRTYYKSDRPAIFGVAKELDFHLARGQKEGVQSLKPNWLHISYSLKSLPGGFLITIRFSRERPRTVHTAWSAWPRVSHDN